RRITGAFLRCRGEWGLWDFFWVPSGRLICRLPSRVPRDPVEALIQQFPLRVDNIEIIYDDNQDRDWIFDGWTGEPRRRSWETLA
ncbi:MAG: hypothetical protein LBQ61_10530, partial [Spirochaetales bacterium]|nr:hypothetical protein [Spirochaetales bacterium]